MSARPTISRRRLLLGGAGVGLSALWWSSGAWWWPTRSRASDGVRLAGLLPHQDSARIVGREYLRGAPAAADLDRLTTLVLRGLDLEGGALAAVDDRRLRQLVLRRTGQDFREGRTVAVDGWLLSATEARLCALAQLCGAAASSGGT